MGLPFYIAKLQAEVESESTRIFQLTKRDLATITTANRDEFQELSPLIDFVINRMEAAFYLMKAGMNWDADNIWRSGLEEIYSRDYFVEPEKEKQALSWEAILGKGLRKIPRSARCGVAFTTPNSPGSTQWPWKKALCKTEYIRTHLSFLTAYP